RLRVHVRVDGGDREPQLPRFQAVGGVGSAADQGHGGPPPDRVAAPLLEVRGRLARVPAKRTVINVFRWRAYRYRGVGAVPRTVMRGSGPSRVPLWGRFQRLADPNPQSAGSLRHANALN